MNDASPSGIVYAQPIVLNERQAGADINTYFAMALARLLRFDLCPRLKELKQRHLYVPCGFDLAETVKPINVASVDTDLIESHWVVHLAASVQ